MTDMTELDQTQRRLTWTVGRTASRGVYPLSSSLHSQSARANTDFLRNKISPKHIALSLYIILYRLLYSSQSQYQVFGEHIFSRQIGLSL